MRLIQGNTGSATSNTRPSVVGTGALRVRTSPANVLGYSRVRRSKIPKQITAVRSGTAEAVNPGAQAVVIPLDFYRVLQSSGAASRDSLVRAATKLTKSKADASYSQAALDSRAVVLKAAVQFLSEPTQRRAYDKSLSLGSPQACPPIPHSTTHYPINILSIIS